MDERRVRCRRFPIGADCPDSSELAILPRATAEALLRTAQLAPGNDVALSHEYRLPYGSQIRRIFSESSIILYLLRLLPGHHADIGGSISN